MHLKVLHMSYSTLGKTREEDGTNLRNIFKKNSRTSKTLGDKGHQIRKCQGIKRLLLYNEPKNSEEKRV